MMNPLYPRRGPVTQFSIVLMTIGCLALPASAATQPASRSDWPPPGEAVRLPVTRDTWFAGVGSATDGNNGGSHKFKLKGRQECSLLDADVSGLKGKVVTGALLHFHAIDPKVPALRMTVSTVATPWVEGTGASYDEQKGAACFNQAALGERDWAYPGSTFMDAAFGRGHTIWRFADATPPDADGWQAVAVDPAVVAARIAGLSHGFGVYDDVGCTWSYVDGKFTYNLYPNRFFHSKDSRNFVPYLQVWVDGEDGQAPAPVDSAAFNVSTDGLPAGEALVTWTTPADAGGSGTLGYNVTYKAGEKTAEMPRYLVPMAGKVGQTVKMHIQDLPFEAGQEIELTIRPVDGAGNVGKPLVRKVKLSSTPRVFPIADSGFKPAKPHADLPEVAGLKVAVIDLVDKVEAKTGKMVPDHPAGYKGGNHLWSAKDRTIRLQAARNEHVCFQVNLEGKSEGVTAKLTFADNKNLKPAVYRFDYVNTTAGLMPDICVPLSGALPIPATDDPEAAEQSNASLLCEVYVPHAAPAGSSKGELVLTSAGQTLRLPVELAVWDFTLPNTLSWVPEMNCYGGAAPTGKGLDYYRLTHEHRTCLTQLHSRWNGRVDFGPPVGEGGKVDWSDWSKQFGRLFDGSAFAGLPRDGEPLERFYLPFNETWPIDYYKHYTKSYWPEQALSDEYKAGMRRAFADFAKMADGRGWHETIFWFFLNGKVYNKRVRDWDQAISTWVMDEPRDIQDFWALRWYGILFHEAVAPVRGDAKMWYRADVSYSPWGRDTLWGICDMECMGGNTVQKVRMKRDEQVLWGTSTFTQYGSANHPKDPNIQPIVWCLSSWANGSVGVVAWQVMAGQENWSAGNETAVLYPHEDGPMASVRLKAFRQGQQMVEYLTMLEKVYSQPHFAVAAGMGQVVDLKGVVHKAYEDDAGTIRFDKADPIALWTLRHRLGSMLNAKKPPYQRCIQPVPTPQTGPDRLPDIGYVRVAPKVEPARPE